MNPTDFISVSGHHSWPDQILTATDPSHLSNGPQPSTNGASQEHQYGGHRISAFPGQSSITGTASYQPQAAPSSSQSAQIYDPNLFSMTLNGVNSISNGMNTSQQTSNLPQTSGYYSAPYTSTPLHTTSSFYSSYSSLPISQWSSLQGATGISASSSSLQPSSSSISSTPTPTPTPQHPQPQQQQQQTLQHHLSQQSPTSMSIDPNLTNFTLSNAFQTPNPYRMSYYANTMQQPGMQPQTLQPPAAQNTYQQLVISPSLLTRSTSNTPTPQIPGQAVSSPPNDYPQAASDIGVFTNIGRASLAPTASAGNMTDAAGSSPSSPSNTPVASVLPVVRSLLTSNILDKQPALAAKQVISQLSSTNLADIDCPTRVEILTKIRDGAGKEFYKVWAKSQAGMGILRTFLLNYLKDMSTWDQTIMPLLFIIERLPLEISDLQSAQIGKGIIKVIKEAPSSAAKDLASNIESKWRKMIPSNAPKSKAEEAALAAKKRKLDPVTQSSAKAAPPTKKVAVAAPASSAKGGPIVKKEIVKPGSTKDAKSDSSFFSSKPKQKLPSFRKVTATVPPKKEEAEIETAKPSSIDPFQEALKSMGRGRSGTPQIDAVVTPNTTTDVTMQSEHTESSLGKAGKQRKRVTFPPDGKLEEVRLIERAVYEDDEGEGHHHASYRDMDIDEGHALHVRMFEEQIDWYEPIAIELRDDQLPACERGAESTEKVTQEEREKNALVAAYMNPTQIPDSASELHPNMDAPPDEGEMVVMLAGELIDSLQNVDEQPLASITNSDLLQDLLANLAGGTNSAPLNAPLGVDYGGGFDRQDTWQTQRPPTEPYSHYAGEDGYSGLPTGSGYSEEWEDESHRGAPARRARGRGGPIPTGPGRGRGRLNRTPCTFWQQGRCRKGDACPFLHD